MKSVCIVVAVPCEKACFVAPDIGKDSVSVIFELVQPIIAFGDLVYKFGKLHIGHAKRIFYAFVLCSLTDFLHRAAGSDACLVFGNVLRGTRIGVLLF
ncbi:hypothetical protein SDC9_94629 [bioreactor metagenome]|uniref:Uncharacterized protein n=1 Tax=bioreactor metagenome TaxID=1076179 RepID=A0A645A5D7_9ZZZZ